MLQGRVGTGLLCILERYMIQAYTMPLFCTMVFSIGTEEEQTQYCFQIYDINSDGFITREEMTTLMKNCLMRYREENI